MTFKLAYRNLFHDRLSLIVTLVGILFSVVLLSFQTGIYIGLKRTIASVLDKTTGALWIIPKGTKSIDNPSLLPGREKYAALRVAGVENVEMLLMAFARWRKQTGELTTVLIVGSDWSSGGLKPWNLVEGSVSEIEQPMGVAVDLSYLQELGVSKIGEHGEINQNMVIVRAFTQNIRSFTTMPYVFMPLSRAQSYLGISRDQSSYQIVHLKKDSDIEKVRRHISLLLPDVEILTKQEFRTRSINYWLFQTGAGAGLLAGVLLAIVIGIAIVSQTLYAGIKEHLNEFATLRALGASSGYIIQVILFQAVLSAIIGYLLGITLTLVLFSAAQGTSLHVVLTPQLAGLLFLITVVMCILAALSAIIKVIRIAPSAVFR